jgi:hypothetical protein
MGRNVYPQDLQECLETFHREFDARLPFTMWYRLSDMMGSIAGARQRDSAF